MAGEGQLKMIRAACLSEQAQRLIWPCSPLASLKDAEMVDEETRPTEQQPTVCVK